jgi:hypothetical protein
MSGVIHIFDADLAESATHNGAWDTYYKTIWKDQISRVEVVEDHREQLHGIDRRIVLRSGQIITVDEKHRLKDYGDILLELWSVFHAERDQRNRRGWTLDWEKRCDYIAWCVIPSDTCRLLPYDQLRRTTWKHMKEWVEKRGMRYAENENYTTINVPVSWEDLYRCLRADSISRWNEVAA